MPFRLENAVLNNIVDASKYEWLEGAGSGNYSGSTCVGMNTRREHGLFVVPGNGFQNKIVVLSKLEESVFIENRLHEISTNQYTGGIFPQGFKYLDSFEINPFPRFTYRIEDRILQKTVFMVEEHSMLVVRYELKNQGKPVDLVIKPFIADRLNNELSNETQGLNTDSYRGQRFVRWAPRTNMPELYIYFDQGDYVTATLWYHNFYYPRDFGRYEGQSEDLFNPGFFQTQLRPYESINLYISTKNLDDVEMDFEAQYRQEFLRRSGGKKFFGNHKKLAQFERIVNRAAFKIKNTPLINISAIEHNFTTRDMLFSIPGTLFFTKRFDLFKDLYRYLISRLDNGLLPTKISVGSNGVSYGAVDLPLWLIQIGYQYYRLTEDLAFFNDDLFEALLSIYENYNKGTQFNIYEDKDGLLFCGDKKTSLSWIPLKAADGTVLRYGKLLEVNALWYNALQIMELLSTKLKKRRWATRFQKHAEKCKKSFNDLFVNEGRDAFFDVVNADGKDATFRISQIIPLALPFVPVEQSTVIKVFGNVRHRLLTPYGLRSCALSANRTQAHNPVALHRYTADYYKGAVWPWTISLYVEAFTRIYQDARDEMKELYDYFQPLVDLSQEGLLGYVPEAITVNNEVSQNGITDYTPASSAILWSFFKLIIKMRK